MEAFNNSYTQVTYSGSGFNPELHLIPRVLVDSNVNTDVTFSIVGESLTATFPRFNASLVWDPGKLSPSPPNTTPLHALTLTLTLNNTDFGVTLQQSGGGGDGSSTSWIIAVAVVVPVVCVGAVLFVVVVLVVVAIINRRKFKRKGSQFLSAVHLTFDDDVDSKSKASKDEDEGTELESGTTSSSD